MKVLPQSSSLPEALKRLAPFARRAGIIVTGREKLALRSRQLQLALIAVDAAENTVREIMQNVRCPHYQALTGTELETLFGLKCCRVLGLLRSGLAEQIQQLLRPFALPSPGSGTPCAWDLPPRHPAVAILGASGIGRHHAKWWKTDGAHVVAFLGSTPESVCNTAAALHQHLGGLRPPRGFCSLAELIAQTHPDIADICLPPPLHYAAAREALHNGLHVICEKPFLYDPALPVETLMAQADELIALAAAKRRMLGMASQYYGQVQYCRRLRTGDITRPVEHLRMELFTVLRQHSDTPVETWIDLGPHLLAAMQAVQENRRLDPASIRLSTEGSTTTVTAICQADGLPPLTCELKCGRIPNAPGAQNRRFLALDHVAIDCLGCRDQHGHFQMNLKRHDTAENHYHADFLRVLLENFGAGRVIIPGETARDNLKWLLHIARLITPPQREQR